MENHFMSIIKKSLLVGACLNFIFISPLFANGLSNKTYEIHTGDFNNDGKVDILHQAKNGTDLHGIIAGAGNGQFTEQLQTWSNGHMGLNWDTSSHRILAGKLTPSSINRPTNVFLQPTQPGQDSHIILPDEDGNIGHINAIRTSIPDGTLGLNWSSKHSRMLLGDFNGDTRQDIFFQAVNKSDQNALVNLNRTGYYAFSSGWESKIQEPWSTNYLDLEWSTQTHVAHVGDFNGDGRDDIFLQAKYQFVLIPMDGLIIPIRIEPKTLHSILLSDANGKFTEASQQWDNTHLGLGSAWMADESNVVILDSNNNGRDEIFLQGKLASSTHYLIPTNTVGYPETILQSWKDGYLGQTWSGNSVTLNTGDFNSDNRTDFILTQSNGTQNIVTAAPPIFSLPPYLSFTGSSSVYNNVTDSLTTQIVTKPASNAFGILAGDFSVDNNGAANYAIPINVPPGIAGMQPSLSMVYSSSAGNGLLGTGWSLAGLSAIHRCPKNFAQDGTLDGINLDANDKLCFDGQRLIAVNGVYGKLNTEYRTELDSFSRIIGKGGDLNSGSEWFQVETKSGQLIEYGRSNDGAAKYKKADNEIVTSSWSVNKVTDSAGNYLLAKYHQNTTTGEHYPLQIDYTFNDKPGSAIADKSAPLFSVKLVYEDRKDTVSGYFKTAKTNMTKRLARVETYTKNSLVKKYLLTYEYDKNTRLSRIKYASECDAAGNCKESTELDWQNGQRWPETHLTTGICTDSSCNDGFYQTTRNSSRYVDFNGDGYMDVCYLKPQSGIECIKGSASGFDTSSGIVTTDVCKGGYDQYGGCKNETHFKTIKYVDLNNDGYTDVMFRTEEGLQFVLSNGTPFSTHINTGIYPIKTCSDTNYTYCAEDGVDVVFPNNTYNDMFFPDINGDSFPDLCIRKESGLVCYLNQQPNFSLGKTTIFAENSFSTGICNEGPLVEVSPNSADEVEEPTEHDGRCYTPDNFNSIQFIDINSDGKSDLVYTTEYGVQYYLSTGTGYTNRVNTGICKVGDASCGNSYYNKTIKFPDVNGDTIPDMCLRTASGIKCLPGTGEGFGSSYIIDTDICANGSTKYGVCNDDDNYNYIQYADLNGDGKADLTYRGDDGIQSWLSTGSAFVDHYSTDICKNGDATYHCSSADNNWGTIAYADLNGDGMADLTFRGNDGFMAFISDGKTPNQLTSVTDGFKNKTNINYKRLNDSAVHTACTGAQYPERCVTAPLNVVSSYSASNGVNGLGSYSYHYTGSRVHMRGRGLLGFSNITKTDEQTNIVTSTWTDDLRTIWPIHDSYADFYPYLGMMTRKTTRLNGVLLSSVDNTLGHNSTILSLPGVTPIFPFYEDSTETSFDFDTSNAVTTTIIQNFFDEPLYTNGKPKAGNLTRVISTTYDQTNIAGYTDKIFTKTTTSTFDDLISATQWQVGRLKSTTVKHKNVSDTKTRTSNFGYTAQGLLETTIVEQGDNNLELTTVNSYGDPYGTVTQVLTKGNAGALLPVSDRTTRTLYDGSVNTTTPKMKTFNSLNQSETKTLDARFGVVTNLVGPNGLPTSWEFDSFGRKLRENRADGTYSKIIRSMCTGNCAAVSGITPTYKITTETFGTVDVSVYYDSLGRELRSESTNVNGQVVYKDTVYDAKGRMEKVSQSYFANSSGDENWLSTQYDALNRPHIETQEGSGLVKTVTYAPLSTTVSVTNPSGLNGGYKTHVKTKYNYANGKLRQVSENKNTTTFVDTVYHYDAVGNLTEVNAPNSPPVRMNYDAKGRFKISMDDPDMGHWEYKHDVYGQLRQQTNAKLQQTDMVYDVLGRMVLRVEEEGASVWQYDTAANGIGKLDRVIGPIALSSAQLTAQRSSPSVVNALAVATTQTFARHAQYDTLGRPIASVTYIDGSDYKMETSYDSTFSRVDTVTYPQTVKQPTATRLTTKNVYDNNGFLIRLENAANNAVYWRLGDQNGDISDAVNAKGQTLVESFGNGLKTTRVYNPVLNHLEAISTGVDGLAEVQNLEYVFDSIGNLEQRLDRNRVFTHADQTTSDIVESFTYDHLNRLKTTTLNSINVNTFDYDDNGNISYRSGFGVYQYNGNSGPHAVDKVVQQGNEVNILNTYAYDANGNMTSDNTRSITYTSFNKPNKISNASGDYFFSYGADHARYKQVKPSGETHYVGKSFERVTEGGLTKDIHYLSVGGGVIGTVTVHTSATTEDDILYFHKDHIGSTDVVTRQLSAPVNGLLWKLEESMSFSAFGERRQLEWNAGTLITASSTTRGYTGHEQLDNVGFIHMNGRVYDPKLGRFISADPFIQSPDSTQNYNRYSYVNNNPLSYTDPSGYWSLKSIMRELSGELRKASPYIRTALIMYVSYQVGGALGNGTASLSGAAYGGAIYAAATGGNVLQGALTGMAFFSVGQQFTGKLTTAQQAKYIFAHGIVGGVTTELSGGKFSAGFFAAAVGKSVTIGLRGPGTHDVTKFAGAVVSGGIASKLSGGEFGDGALTAMMGYLFNELSKKNSSGLKVSYNEKTKMYRFDNGRGIVEFNKVLSGEQTRLIDSLLTFSEEYLEGEKIYIYSSYRDSKTSQHGIGIAADIYVISLRNDTEMLAMLADVSGLFNRAASYHNNTRRNTVHVDFKPDGNQGRFRADRNNGNGNPLWLHKP